MRSRTTYLESQLHDCDGQLALLEGICLWLMLEVVGTLLRREGKPEVGRS
jgi:hypothetical protein